jgi:glutathione synthase/RimK-type ligase-like ATP-grasp enzyme
MVLICGDPLEAVTAFLCSRLKMFGIDHRILDLRSAPDAVSIDWSGRDSRVAGSISSANWKLQFDELTGVYFRNVWPDPGDYSESETDIYPAYPRTDPRIATVLNRLPCRVVNRPAAVYSNRSKPFQALIIRRFGFKIPRTLITNDPEASKRFYDECEGKVISKLISGVRSIVRRVNEDDLGPAGLREQRLTQLQEYIPGDNIRVHVIGESLFPVRIQSQAVDYRYAAKEGYARTMVAAKLPENVESHCLRLTRQLDLAMSGIDLKETPAGELYCFEVNTSPAFPFYESPARPVVADALGQFLAERGERP